MGFGRAVTTWLDRLVGFAHEQVDGVRPDLYCRGATDEQIELFQIGYLNQKLPDLEGAAGFLEWCWQGRRLDNVLVLPLTNALGQIRGVQFRSADREKKGYQDYFLSKDEAVLFGLAQAIPSIWETESVFLVEGAFDLFPVQRVTPNVVATLTDRISDPFGRLLRRLVRELWVGYDVDKAGSDARRRIELNYGRDFKIRSVEYPRVLTVRGDRVKDPGELWEVWGEEHFQEYLRGKISPPPVYR